MNAEIIEKFGNQVRIRVCGICRNDDKILMVNHKHLTPDNFWAPPGGGLQFGESIQQGLLREFEQETGFLVDSGRFLFGCEFRKKPLHAVELFFEVFITDGRLRTGIDPELSSDQQIISEVSFLTPEEIDAIPYAQKHGIFKHCDKTKHLSKLSGFYII